MPSSSSTDPTRRLAALLLLAAALGCPREPVPGSLDAALPPASAPATPDEPPLEVDLPDGRRALTPQERDAHLTLVVEGSCTARALQAAAPDETPTSPAAIERLGAWLDTRRVDLERLERVADVARDHPALEPRIRAGLQGCGGPTGRRLDDPDLLLALRLRRRQLPDPAAPPHGPPERYLALAADLLCLALADPPAPDPLARRAELLQRHGFTEESLHAESAAWADDASVAAGLAAAARRCGL